MEYNHKALGERVAFYRGCKELPQKALADLAGISQGYLANLELGKGKSASLDTVMALAAAVGVTVDDLLIDSLDKYHREGDSDDLRSQIAAELRTLPPDKLTLYGNILDDFIRYKGKNHAR